MNSTFKSKTASTGFFTQKQVFRTTMSALPSIFVSKGDTFIPNNQMKEKILSLKKELNKRIFEYKELKLAHAKLNQEKELNQKLLNEAITEIKTTGKPLELTRSNSAREMRISFESYSKLKESNTIASMKHQISLLQKMLKQKDEEIDDLKSDSKINKLIERNNQLVEIMNKTSQLANGIHDLKLLLSEKQNKHSEDISNRDYYKALNTTLKCENEMLIEKYSLLLSAVDLRSKKVLIHQDKANNLKYKYNTTKQTEKTRDIELKIHQEQLSYEEDYKTKKEKAFEANRENVKIILHLKEEIEAKEKMIKALEKNNCDYLQQMNKIESEMKRSKMNENCQIEALKKEMIRLDKEMMILRFKKEGLIKECNKIKDIFEWESNIDNRIKVNNETCSIYRDMHFDIIIKDTYLKKKMKLELKVDTTVNNVENISNSILLSANTTSIPNTKK